MNTTILETVVRADHLLRLPKEFPAGCRVRVTLEPISASDPADEGIASSRQSALGKNLQAIRQRALAKGMKLQTLDEILDEISGDRGESVDD